MHCLSMAPFYFQMPLWKVTYKQQIIILINIEVGLVFGKMFSNSAKHLFTSDVSVYYFVCCRSEQSPF